MMQVTEIVGCPCCGEEMDSTCVVCWDCYRSSNRLTAGTYPDSYSPGATFTLTAADIERYDSARAARLGW